MRLRWTNPAAQGLYDITQYIRNDNARAGRETAKLIYDGCQSLVRFPHRGRNGSEPGTRELVFLPLPYIPAYRVFESTVEILGIHHGARQLR